jgi:hypothetical protein
MTNNLRLKMTLLTTLFLFGTPQAGSMNLGIGMGMTHALLAPKIGYEFDNGAAIDFSASYFKPDIDVALGLCYNFKFCNNEVYLGPRISLGKRELEFSNDNGFEASFIGLAGNVRAYFLQKYYYDFQIGFEGFRSKYYLEGNSVGFEPSIGMSCGYEFNKILIGNKRKADLNNFSKIAIITGQILGGILTTSGIVVTGATIPEMSHPDQYGITQGLFIIGLSSACFGILDMIFLNKLKFSYTK